MDVLKDIFDNLSDAIIIVDAHGQVVLYNNEALRIQKSVSETPIQIGTHYADLAGDGQRDTISEIFKTLKRQKKPIKNFAEFVTPFGTSVFLEINFVPVLGPRRELRYINIISHDITSRKIFERKARAAAADVNNLIQHAHAVIFSVDSRGYIVEWNQHSEKITGFGKKEILSRKMTEVLIGESSGGHFDCLMAAVLENKPVGEYELPLRTKANGEVILRLSATPRTNANGQVIGATMVGQDVTELMRYRRSLEKLVENKTAALEQVLRKEKEAVELKSRFVSIASHEFRSPLSSIDYAASFIKQNAGTIGKKKLNEKVAVIEKHVSHMSHLLEDVLNFSANNKGDIRIIPSEINLEKFIRDAVEEVTCHTQYSHHICVSTNTLGALITDEKLLRNILINLLNNAIKFSPGREEVFLNVLDRGTEISIEVEDDGVGIPGNELHRIFEPFIRGKSAGAIQGTGLGLSIVKKAVDLLNGHIQVESVPGEGSVFSVVIPRQEFVI